MRKRILLCLASVAISFAMLSSVQAETRTITDVNGTKVEVPMVITKVANLWNSNNETLVQLGAGDIFVGGSNFLVKRQWMTTIFPQAFNIKVISEGRTANAEATLELDPDVIFSVSGRADALREIGETVIELNGGNSPEDLMHNIGIVAETLGEKYVKNANEFFKYFQGNIDLVEKIATTISEKDRLTVLHGTTTKASVTGTLINTYIESAGATNPFESQLLEGGAISYENILEMDPDVIIVAYGEYNEYVKFTTDPLYSDVKAVKNGKVFINPAGMFFWDAYTGEQCLEVLWLAKTIYPKYYADINVEGETRAFYKKYFDYNMTDKEIEFLLSGKNPDGSWQ